jgi:hypothetical protein
MNKDDLIFRIENTFPDSPGPSREGIIRKDAYREDVEFQKIESFFEHRAWRHVSPADVFRFRDALILFSPPALVYFSASWMVASLVDAGAVDTAIFDLAYVYGITTPTLWTATQRSCICDWLKYFESDLLKHRYQAAVQNFECPET